VTTIAHVLRHFLPRTVLEEIGALSASFERNEAYRVYVLKRMWFIIPLALLFVYVSSIYSFKLFLLIFSASGFTSSISGWILSCLLGACAAFWFVSLILQIYLLLVLLQGYANRNTSPRDHPKETLKLSTFVGIPAWIFLLMFGTWWPTDFMVGHLASRDEFSISSATKASVFEPNAAIRQYWKEVEEQLEAQATVKELGTLKAQRMRGTILIRIQVLRTGLLETAEVIRPADDSVINEVACRLIRKAAPFPVFPAEMSEMNNIVIVRKLTFNFSNSPPMLMSTTNPERLC